MTRLLTKQIAETQSNRALLFNVTFRELTCYVIFLVLLTIVALGFTSISMFHLNKAFEQQFYEKEYTEGGLVINIRTMESIKDFWRFLTATMYHKYFWNHTENDNRAPKKKLYENQILGTLRLRQLRVRPNSCKVPKAFTNLAKECYSEYRLDAEDHDEIFHQVDTILPIAWIYQSAESIRSVSHKGTVAVYGGGGYVVDFIPIPKKTQRILDEIERLRWSSRATRALLLQFTVYNTNLNLFCVVKLLFEFPPTGSIITSSTYQTFRFFGYVSNFDYFMLSCEGLVAFYALLFTLEEIREVIYFRLNYFCQFWTYIDLAILIMIYILIAVSLLRYFEFHNCLQTYLKNLKGYANFEYVAQLNDIYNDIIGVLLIVAYIKLFKYMSFNKSMGQLNSTLKRCAIDIFGFSIMFFIIFYAYSELGYLLFGSEAHGFSTLENSMFTLLRTILGDFNYKEIEDANPTLAPTYFLSYIFLVFFILLNMFLAIINDTYSDVKTEIHLRPDEMQMSDYVKRGINSIMSVCGCASMAKFAEPDSNNYKETLQQIRNVLKRFGFDDLEIEMFFARYNIHPTAEVGQFDISELMVNLEEDVNDSKKLDQNTIKGTKNKPIVHIHDFVAQQERLEHVETRVAQLTDKVDALLKKLDALQTGK